LFEKLFILEFSLLCTDDESVVLAEANLYTITVSESTTVEPAGNQSQLKIVMIKTPFMAQIHKERKCAYVALTMDSAYQVTETIRNCRVTGCD
jgi:hypothetical protein